VEGSLKRLRLERIDVYQLQISDPVVSFDLSIETLAQLREESKIRNVALSNVTQEHRTGSQNSPHCFGAEIVTASRTASGTTL
jgi:aryl-alcohol dehydrogenase-like predicted oxidoreductase